MAQLECAAPHCAQAIPQARLKRYLNTKTCSPPCAKEHRKAYVANWMGFYLLKKADIDTDPRWAQAQAMEEKGDELGALIERNKVKQQAMKADQNRRHQSGGDIKTYREMVAKRPPRG